MSKICILIFQTDNLINKNIINQIQTIFNKNNLFFFTELEYDEPFFSELNLTNHLVLSIADNKYYNNCEMLLLPDNCYFNGKTNKISFDERMLLIKGILLDSLCISSNLHLFIGESGTLFDEFMHLKTTVEDFSENAQKLNSEFAPDIHFYLQNGT